MNFAQQYTGIPSNCDITFDMFYIIGNMLLFYTVKEILNCNILHRVSVFLNQIEDLF